MERWLFALDFDNTILDEDSDQRILEQLAPQLIPAMRALQATMQWTDLCNKMVGQLFEQSITPAAINTCQRAARFNPIMASVLERMHAQGANDVLIISDANTVYINEICEEKLIGAFVTRVITNPAHYDAEGRLHIERLTPPDQVHGCKRKCGPNLCKGKELNDYIAASAHQYLRKIYVGDGANDFCPSQNLSAHDYCLPRKGRRFSKILENPVERSKIKATIVEWDTAEDILAFLVKIM